MDSQTVATWVLVGVTFVYVVFTGAYVREVRAQRADDATRDKQRRRDQILATRHAISGELR